MARLSCEKRAELEGFWRSHHDEWERSTLNQREYCKVHSLPLKRFGNWRAKFKTETAAIEGKLLYRRGGNLRHMASHMSDKEIASASTDYVPSVKSMPNGRRNFRVADKKRIVAEALAPGASVSGIARHYGIDTRLLFRWKREFAPPPSEPVFLPVTVSDGIDQTDAHFAPAPTQVAGPIIVERSPQEIEVELIGGRRVRFGCSVEAEAVRAMIALLEGPAS
jgi:transposase